MANVLIEQNKDLSLETISTQFLALKNSAHTRKAYRIDIRQFLCFLNITGKSFSVFLKIPLPEMTDAIARFLEKYKKRDIDGHVINPNTINRKRYTLVSFFRYLMEAYDFQKNPALLIPVLQKSKHSNTSALSEAEIRQTMRYMKEQRTKGKKHFRDYLIILGLFHFALRRHELASLKWSDIHHPNHFRLREKGGKIKYLPIPPKYFQYLKEFEELYGRPCSYIFHPIKNNRTKTLEKPLSTNTLLIIVEKVAVHLFPGRGITPHSFRSSFVSLARDNGVDDKMIMNATGHSSSDMINYYDVRHLLRANAVHFFGEWIE